MTFCHYFVDYWRVKEVIMICPKTKCIIIGCCTQFLKQMEMGRHMGTQKSDLLVLFFFQVRLANHQLGEVFLLIICIFILKKFNMYINVI